MFPILLTTTLTLIHYAIFASAATPAPVSVTFPPDFYGTDGLWSAAQIRVGTPDQWLSVFPNTVGSETWVVSPAGCGAQYKCQSLRGGVFYSNASQSYSRLGSFELVGTNRLGYKTNAADYGSDNISISDTISANPQVIANLFDPENWLGELGLGVQHPRFTDSTKYLPFISSLVENSSVIPSHSYGYTAGAYYSPKKVPGSLVLGGVDTTRFKPNGVSFQLSSDYQPLVAVQSITVGSSRSQGLMAIPPTWNYNPNTLLQPGSVARFVIDSSTPFMWMPTAVCDTFASALNLTYDDNLQLYKYSTSSSGNNTNGTSGTSSLQTLKDWGLTFTFSLANSLDDSGTHVEIPISFDAFNLQLTYGYPGSGLNEGDAGINYFPLRRTNSSTQYTLGRAFLQESYLTVDYERNTFSVQPAILDVNTATPNLVAISRPSGSKWPGPSDGSLSTGAKAGIAIAIIVVLLGVGAVIFFVVRRKRAQQGGEKPARKRKWGIFKQPEEPEYPVYQPEPPSEMLADRRQPRELLVDSSNTRCELLVDSSNTRFELPGHTAIEMPADDVPEVYLSTKQKPGGAVVETREVNLRNHSSIRKDYPVRTTGTERSHSPAPPYSPGDIGQNSDTSEGVSSYNPRHNGNLDSPTSSGAAVSPIGPLGPHSPTDGIISPASPEMRSPHLGFHTQSESTTQSSTDTANLVAAADRIARAGSRDSRFREELVNSRERTTDHHTECSSIHSRYSWEQ